MTITQCLAAFLVSIALSGCGPSAQEIAAAKAVEERLRVAEERLHAEEKERKIKQQYNDCVSNVVTHHNNNWTSLCEQEARRHSKELQECITDPMIMNNPYMGEGYCKRLHGNIDGSKDCLLPKSLAAPLDSYTQAEKSRCIAEAKLGS